MGWPWTSQFTPRIGSRYVDLKYWVSGASIERSPWLAFAREATKPPLQGNQGESPCCLRSRQGCKAKLLLHFGSRVVTMKGEDLSTLQVKNIAARDIYCLARWSDSP